MVSLTAAETLPVVVGNLLTIEGLTVRSLIAESLTAVASLLVAVESLAAAANLTTQSSTAESLTVGNPAVESLVARNLTLVMIV